MFCSGTADTAFRGGGTFKQEPPSLFYFLTYYDAMTQTIPDLSSVFTAYEALVAEADTLFNRVREQHPECVTCTTGCSDCCHAVFDLSLVEAFYLNRAFLNHFAYGPARSAILEDAAQADRHLTKMKRDYFRQLRDAQGAPEAMSAIMEEAAKARVRCPLLGRDETCSLYTFRPITCRLYGIPTAIGGKAHVCGKARFTKGAKYPTVYLDKIQDRLDQLSREIQETVQSRYKELHQVYVPVTMALLTNYDATYLGIGPAPKE